jgi:hypothetical protein
MATLSTAKLSMELLKHMLAEEFKVDPEKTSISIINSEEDGQPVVILTYVGDAPDV